MIYKQIDPERRRLAQSLGVDESEITRLAMDTHADVRTQMQGLQDRESRTLTDHVTPGRIAPTSSAPSTTAPPTRALGPASPPARPEAAPSVSRPPWRKGKGSASCRRRPPHREQATAE
jgi:hypothetical protein